MLMASPRFTLLLGAAVAALAASALYLWWPRLPEIPEHPYLSSVPEDIGEIKLKEPLVGYTERAIFHVMLPVPHELEEIEPLGQCPPRHQALFWKRRRLGVLFFVEDALQWEAFEKALATTPAAAPATREARVLLALKAMRLPRTGSMLTLRRFLLHGLKGFQMETDAPIVDSREGHTTIYYLFPEGQEDPPLRVEIVERRRRLERTEEGIHSIVAGMSYPAIAGDPKTRMLEAEHARRHGAYDIAMFEALALTCGPYRRDALIMLAKMAVGFHKLELAREAIRALERLSPQDPVVDDLFMSVHEKEQEIEAMRARGEEPTPPAPWSYGFQEPESHEERH